MRCACINEYTNIVENLIVANAKIDSPPNGFYLIQIPEDSPVQIGWTYDRISGDFTQPLEP